MNVLVIGANGKVGKNIVKEASQAGHRVRAMIRNEAQAEDMKKLGGEPFVADLESDFEPAFEQMEIVVFTAGSGPKTGPDKTIDVDQVAAIKSMDVAREYNIKQYIMVSALGARDPENATFIQHYFRAKKIADDYLMQSGLIYSIFRPGRLTDDESQGKITISTEGILSGPTRRTDLAKAIVFSIDLKATFNKVIEITDGDIPLAKALHSIA